MNRFRIFVLGVVAAAPLVAVPATGASATPLQLPAGYENFTTEVDYASFIGAAVRGSGSLTCKVDSTQGLPTLASTLVSPGSVLNLDDSTVSSRLNMLFSFAGSEVAATCDVNVLLPTDRQTFTGTVSNPVLKDYVGTDSGAFTLDCDLKGSIAVSASIRMGAALGAQKFAMTVNSASTQVPFFCAMSMDFAGPTPSSLNGTVEGRADVTSSVSPNPCTGSSVKSCAPIQLKDAVVTVTNGTGKFAGLNGSGTYNFVDTFSLPFVEQKLASVTASSVGSAGVRSAGVRTSAVSAEQMLLTLTAGKPKASIVLPGPVAGQTQATVSRSSRIVVSTVAKSKCAWSARSRKSASVATTTAAANGQTALVLTGARMKAFLKSGVKTNGTVTVTAKCTAGKKSVTVLKKFTYTG